MNIVDIIILVILAILNIAAVITWNVTTKDITIGQRILNSILFLIGGIIYWLNLIIIAIKNIKK